MTANRALLLQSLRSLSGISKTPPQRSHFPCSFLASTGKPGIPRGALTEISGSPGNGKTELLLRFLAENPEVRVAWIEERLTIYPRAFPQAGVALERVLFAECSEHALWTAHQVLRSQLFPVVVLGSPYLWVAKERQKLLRRLQIAAEQAQASLILLGDEPSRHDRWAITLQLVAYRVPALTAPQIRVVSEAA